MQTLLERLDIHPKVQSFFTQIKPTGIAGEISTASDLFITSSSLDAITWLHLNHTRYRTLNNLCFYIIGHVPEKYHAEFIHQYALKKKLHFLFSKDDSGAICDLKLASFIRSKPLKISYKENQFKVFFENTNYAFERLSLNALEKASGYNFKIRTHKPKNAISYYEQLRNRHPT